VLKRGIPLFLLLIFHFSVLNGQGIITADGYMELVSNYFAGMRDYEANIGIRSGSTEMAGRVSYLSPNFLRIDFSRPAEQVINFNGEALTVYVPDMRAVLSQTLTSGRRGAPGSGSAGLTLLRRNYVASFVTGPNPEPLDPGSSERVVKLRLTRRTAAEGFREIIVSINPDTRTIRRMEGRTIGDGEVVFNFTNIRINQGIPEQRFLYDPPPSANMYNNFLFRLND